MGFSSKRGQLRGMRQLRRGAEGFDSKIGTVLPNVGQLEIIGQLRRKARQKNWVINVE